MTFSRSVEKTDHSSGAVVLQKIISALNFNVDIFIYFSILKGRWHSVVSNTYAYMHDLIYNLCLIYDVIKTNYERSLNTLLVKEFIYYYELRRPDAESPEDWTKKVST